MGQIEVLTLRMPSQFETNSNSELAHNQELREDCNNSRRTVNREK